MNSLMLRSIALGLLATTPLPASHSQPNPPLVAPRAAMQATQSPAWSGTTAGNTPLQRLAAAPALIVLEDEPIPIRQRQSGIPAELARIVDQVISKPVERRFQRAADFQQSLKAVYPRL